MLVYGADANDDPLVRTPRGKVIETAHGMKPGFCKMVFSVVVVEAQEISRDVITGVGVLSETGVGFDGRDLDFAIRGGVDVTARRSGILHVKPEADFKFTSRLRGIGHADQCEGFVGGSLAFFPIPEVAITGGNGGAGKLSPFQRVSPSGFAEVGATAVLSRCAQVGVFASDAENSGDGVGQDVSTATCSPPLSGWIAVILGSVYGLVFSVVAGGGSVVDDLCMFAEEGGSFVVEEPCFMGQKGGACVVDGAVIGKGSEGDFFDFDGVEFAVSQIGL